MSLSIAVIIPTYCEAREVTSAVACAQAVGDEVLVVDGQSPDGTAALARRAGARVLVTRRGRGHQLHVGARAARADTLLFLHADTRLPAEARTRIREALARPDVHGGNFRVEFSPRSASATLFACVYDARRRFTRRYYGDSALFVRRRTYEALGGIRPQPIFEDYEFICRLERRYRTCYVREVAATTSARRFQDRVARSLAIWSTLHALYALGASPDRLARLYADRR